MVKSIDYHAANITQITAELSQIPEYHPWSGKLSITIHRAENEQTGWKSEELGKSTDLLSGADLTPLTATLTRDA